MGGISSSPSDSKLRPQQRSDKLWTPAEQSKGLSTAVKPATASLQRLSLGMYNNFQPQLNLESILYPGCRLFHTE